MPQKEKQSKKSSRGKALTAQVRAARGTTDIRCQIHVNASSPEIKTAMIGRLEVAIDGVVNEELGITVGEA